jgi:hypothetical protein
VKNKYSADGIIRDFVSAMKAKSAQQLADVYKMAQAYLRRVKGNGNDSR